MKILVNGCNGRMGKEVTKQIEKSEEDKVLCGVDRSGMKKNNFPVFSKATEVDTIPEVIIDFSIPVATFEILEFARKNKVPIVIATTGFSKEELENIKNISKEIPIFLSYNMSYDVKLLTTIACQVAQKLIDSDIEIVETHHNQKLDAPSGTAIQIANEINKALDNSKEFVYERHSRRMPRQKKEIGIHSIRGGTEVGKHTIMFFGNNECFEITHTCTSRSIFANGAIKAAKFIQDKENGFYNMDDLV